MTSRELSRLRAEQLRGCGNARRVRRIAAAARRARRNVAKLRDRNACRSWRILDEASGA